MKKSFGFFCVLLSVCMLLTFVPVAAFADESQAWAVYNDTDKTLTFCVGVKTDDGVTRDGDPSLVSGITYEPMPETYYPAYAYRKEITKVIFLDPITVNRTKGMFSGFENMTQIEGLDKLNTENVEDMEGMFDKCSSLESLDLSHFNTANVKCFDCVFSACSSLKSLDLSSFDTGKATSMAEMFGGCISLETLNISGFNTANVKRMGEMFSDCESLTSLDLSSFSTKKVENMSAMFSGCKSLTSLDLNGFSTENVVEMTAMFAGCESLKSLDLSSFSTENVKEMSVMFVACESLEQIDVSSFDLRSVEHMEAMFADCIALNALDLRNFNVPMTAHMGAFFSYSDALSTLQLGENFLFTFLDEGFNEDLGVDISTPGLVQPPQNETYTGYWVKVGGDGKPYTSSELTRLFDGETMAGTWVWEKKPEPVDISAATVTGAPQTYTGEALTTAVTVTLGGATLIEGEDFEVSGFKNNVDAGTATVTVTGKGLYKGSASGTFTVLPMTLAGANVSVGNQTYNGGAVNPPVTVKLGDKTLTEGKDYTVSFENNADAGTASVTVTGIGDYKGTTAGTFTIAPADLTGANVTVPDQIYTGEALTPAVTVTLENNTLTAGKDYTVQYVNNTELTSEAVALVSGCGNYTGAVLATFRIKTEDGVDFLLGDVDGNGKVEAADARYALRAAVGLDDTAVGLDFSKKTNRCFLAADVTKDKNILAVDARLILRAAVGLETLS